MLPERPCPYCGHPKWVGIADGWMCGRCRSTGPSEEIDEPVPQDSRMPGPATLEMVEMCRRWIESADAPRYLKPETRGAMAAFIAEHERGCEHEFTLETIPPRCHKCGAWEPGGSG